MKKLAIYGAGGFGREMALMVRQINLNNPEWNLIGFFDDGIEAGRQVDGLPVIGGIETLNVFSDSIAVCMAIAKPMIRVQIVEKITNKNVSYPVLVHPNALTGSENNFFGRGCIITAGVILTTGISLGEFSIVNLSTTIGHDSSLGDFCTVMPGCSISGNVLIGSQTVMGTGSRIIQGIRIGENCLVGAGGVVTKSFGDAKKIMGVPARSI